MYNKSRLIVRVKHFKSKMVQTSLMLQPLISIGGRLCCQHSKCKAALTYMISGGCTLCNNSTKNYMKFAFQFGKNLKFYSHYHLIFALLYALLPFCSNQN